MYEKIHYKKKKNWTELKKKTLSCKEKKQKLWKRKHVLLNVVP